MMIQILLLSLLFVQSFCRKDLCSPLNPNCRPTMVARSMAGMNNRGGLLSDDLISEAQMKAHTEDARQDRRGIMDSWGGMGGMGGMGGVGTFLETSEQIYHVPPTIHQLTLQLTPEQTERLHAFIRELLKENHTYQGGYPTKGHGPNVYPTNGYGPNVFGQNEFPTVA
ncbi:uncharacterized protein LOC117169674 [Belonocnema kinseyi]|uniref:uncharacterized protein LOC117169674 n=1 Tax=Belonocnema kinseyi TaxID=2817044 RepID=UPI00143CE0E9|nr:uncharacterized protein LOC117169674 [Belonocnema kinseyi]